MDCNCLEHVVASTWLGITGDSYVVQVDRVYKPQGAGSYLSKYFSKTFQDRQALEELGFKRRFAMSRNFPRLQRLRLLGTDEGRWSRVARYSNPVRTSERAQFQDEVARTALERVGDDYLKWEQQKKKFSALRSKVYEDIPSEIRTSDAG